MSMTGLGVVPYPSARRWVVAQPGLEIDGVPEFGTQDPATGRHAEHESVDRGCSAASVRVVQTGVAQVMVPRLQ
jgi:hypothetical protein